MLAEHERLLVLPCIAVPLSVPLGVDAHGAPMWVSAAMLLVPGQMMLLAAGVLFRWAAVCARKGGIHRPDAAEAPTIVRFITGLESTQTWDERPLG